MSERLSITPLGPYIGAQVSGVDITRPLSDNQFEQLYHAVLRHQVVFLREQNITPEQQRDLALRFGDLHIHPVLYRDAARRGDPRGKRAAVNRRRHPVDQRHCGL